MKKLITLYLFSIVVCILVAILVTSCGSNVFIAKRHYTKGYYIEKTDGLASRGEKQTTEQKTVVHHPAKPAYSIARDQQAETPRIELQEKSVVAENATPANNNSGASGSKKITKRPSVSLNPFTNIKTLQEIERKHRSAVLPVDTADDGLSLFWIVIAIILIVWLIGFLAGGFGLGDFIHILLVIALVLLVLWLLRIV